MRKLLTLTTILFGILALLSSCKHDDVMNVSINDVQMVSICVTIPDSETRASETNSAQGIFNNNVLGVENDNYTMRYILQIFDENGRPSDETLIEYSDGTTVSFPVRLVPGRDYTFVVWADFVINGETNTDNHYITKDANGKTDLRNITINEDSWVAMDETRDAFTGIYSTKAAGEKYSGASTINVVLTRPFAKLRVVTTDMEALANLGINPTYAIVEYTTPYRAGFNALTCTPFEADQNNIKVHQMSPTEAYAIVAYGDNTTANKVLFTDYLFASADQNDVVKFNLSVYENADKSGHIKTSSFTTDIAVKRNHLTTIAGSILTEGNNVEVVVNPVFVGNENVDVDDLLNSTEPASNEIWYTSVDGNVVTPNTDAFNVDIVSNTYLNGRGVIRLAGVVTEIGDSAFNNCDNLKTLNINDSITSIGQNAFSGCDALSQIVIPGNIETIGYKAFENCSNVSSIIIEAGNTNLRLAYSFDGISSTTLYVDRDIYGGYNNSPFENVGITTISIGPNMKNIDMFVFSNCKNIQGFNIDRNSQLETIGYCAFYNSNITGLHIPDSVTNIDSTAFAMTSGMGWFTGGSSIYWVGMNGELAYEEASLRTLLRWPSEFSYASVIVSSYYYDKIGSYSFAGIDNLKHCIIAMYDDETIEIGNSAFYHCDNLESFSTVNEPSSTKVNISAIGSNVFANTAIKELNFLDSSFSTVNGTFRNCLNLETLYLPKTVTQIGEEAFENCSNLVNMFIAATNPPSLSADAFNIISDRLTIYVPSESVDMYKTTASWSDYADSIVGYDFDNGVVVK